jgi:hypothetical protein
MSSIGVSGDINEKTISGAKFSSANENRLPLDYWSISRISK